MNSYKQKQKSFIFVAVATIIFLTLFLRMYSYLGNTAVQRYVFWIMLACELLCAGAILIKSGYIGRLFSMPVYRAATAFWLWSCISTLLNTTSLTACIQNIATQSNWFLIFIFFSVYFVSNNRANEGFAKKFSVFFMICTGIYYICWSFSGGEPYVSGTINTIYYFIVLLPLVFVCRRKSIKVLVVAIVVVAIFCSGKRTAFIAVALALIVPILLQERGSGYKIVKRIVVVAGVVAFAWVMYMYISKWFDITLFERLSNIENDNGSGRVFIYKEVLQAFLNKSTTDQIIGSGFNSVALDRIILLISDWTFKTEYTSSHNDFLEVLYDYGLIGLGIYVMFLVQLARCGYTLYRRGNKYYKVYISAYIIFLAMSTTSHLILYPTYIAELLMIFSLGIKESLVRTDGRALARRKLEVIQEDC